MIHESEIMDHALAAGADCVKNLPLGVKFFTRAFEIRRYHPDLTIRPGDLGGDLLGQFQPRRGDAVIIGNQNAHLPHTSPACSQAL